MSEETSVLPADPTASILAKIDAAESGQEPPTDQSAPPKPKSDGSGEARDELPPKQTAPKTTESKPTLPGLPKATTPDAQSDVAPSPDAEDQSEPVPRSRADWNAARQKISAKAIAKLQPTIESLKAELDALKKSGAPKADIEALSKERDELKNLIRSVAIDKDPEFNKEFKAKVSEIETNLKAYFGPEQAADVIRIMQMPIGSDRAKALGDLAKSLNNAFQSSLLATNVSSWDNAHSERASKIEAATQNWEAYQSQIRSSTQQKEVAASQQFEQSFQETIREFSDSGYDYWKKTGESNHDKQVDERIALARYAVTGQMTPKEMSSLALYATLTPHLVERSLSLEKDLAEARQQITRLKGSEPSSASGNHGKESEAPATFKSTQDLADHIARVASESGLS